VDQLPSWRQAERLPTLAEIVVLEREARVEHAAAPFVAAWVPTRRIDVSSTEIRTRIRSGLSIHGFVTDAVARYIAASGLYR
jgi:nicotinate-nucleotide adenylyltransferase